MVDVTTPEHPILERHSLGIEEVIARLETLGSTSLSTWEWSRVILAGCVFFRRTGEDGDTPVERTGSPRIGQCMKRPGGTMNEKERFA